MIIVKEKLNALQESGAIPMSIDSFNRPRAKNVMPFMKGYTISGQGLEVNSGSLSQITGIVASGTKGSTLSVWEGGSEAVTFPISSIKSISKIVKTPKDFDVIFLLNTGFRIEIRYYVSDH
jgi:hypothetical protein